MTRLRFLGGLLMIAGLAVFIHSRFPPIGRLVAGGALESSRVSGAHFPKTIVDPIGQSHLLEQPPRRIASAILAGDEMLSRLVAVERVVGVTSLADDPGISNVAGHYPAAIARNHAGVEELLALQPELVIVASYSDAVTVRLLLAAGIPLVRFVNGDSFREIDTNVRTLAAALGEEARAQHWLDDMWRRISDVEAAVRNRPRPRVLYYSLSGSTAGPGSLSDEALSSAGGFNVIRETAIRGYSRISPELAISLQPDVILMSDWQAGKEQPSPTQMLMEDPAWQDVPAIARRRVYAVHGAWATSVTPFHVQGVEVFARLLHPEVFADDI